MMTSPICYCSRLLMLLALTLIGAPVAAHSVFDHDANPHAPHHATQDTDVVKTSYDPALVNQLIQRYSITGDDHLIEQGWRLLEPELHYPTPTALLQAAWLAQANHQFDSARHYLERVLQTRPGDGQALLMYASVAAVTGDAETARHACRGLAHALSPIVSIACSARLSSTLAQKRTAYARLGLLEYDTLEPGLRAWIASIRGDLARHLGKWQAAEALYNQAYSLFPAAQTRAALLDVLLAQGRYADVLHTVHEDESVPALAVRRLLAAQATGQDVAGSVAAMDRQFSRWMSDSDFRHAREMAMFYLDVLEKPQLAYTLAAENAKIQREDEDLQLLERAKKRIIAENS